MACAGGSADKSEKRHRVLLLPANRHLSSDRLPEALCRRSQAVVSRESTRRRDCRAHKVSDKWRAQEGLPTSKRRAQRSASALTCDLPFVVRPFAARPTFSSSIATGVLCNRRLTTGGRL